jgi:hypothetical protein
MRVIAIESIQDGVLRSYGEGEYIGDKVPDISPFNELRIKNPCIKLDNNKYVWGFQCWWGESSKILEKYKDNFTEQIIVEISDEDIVLPLNEDGEQ